MFMALLGTPLLNRCFVAVLFGGCLGFRAANNVGAFFGIDVNKFAIGSKSIYFFVRCNQEFSAKEGNVYPFPRYSCVCLNGGHWYCGAEVR